MTSTEVPSVPAVVCLVRNIRELVVTAVVLTVTVHAASVATPTEAFVPSVILILLPATLSVTFPLIIVGN